jgi:hypothetical protein
LVAEGVVVEDPCEMSGTKWGCEISPSTAAPPEPGWSYLEFDVLQNLQIGNGG